jgi:hypothetical protein
LTVAAGPETLPIMRDILKLYLGAVLSAFRTRRDLLLENLALRQQLAVLQRTQKRARLKASDRVFWVLLSRLWKRWREALQIIRPETVLRWHRAGFRRYWAWKSRSGRPSIDSEVRALVRRMALANPSWGAPRVHGEVLKLGITISQRAVGPLMPARRKPPSQSWRTFLENHLKTLVSLDFFTVPTATFRVLFVLVVLAHDRRRVVHFNVTANPSATWTAQQMVEAFPWDTAPRYLLRDRDGVYGQHFRRRVQGMGIAEVLTAPQSPWQNPYAERLIGSIRRERLDQVIVLGERHLRRILASYFRYYHLSRCHLSLAKDSPEPRAVQPPTLGQVIELPEVGGLHHRYERRAA